jgi:hypothetical protein
MVLGEPCAFAAGGESPTSRHLPLKSEPLDFVDLPLPSPGPSQVQKAEVQEFELRDSSRPLVLLKQGKLHGAAFLRIPH